MVHAELTEDRAGAETRLAEFSLRHTAVTPGRVSPMRMPMSALRGSVFWRRGMAVRIRPPASVHWRASQASEAKSGKRGEMRSASSRTRSYLKLFHLTVSVHMVELCQIAGGARPARGMARPRACPGLKRTFPGFCWAAQAFGPILNGPVLWVAHLSAFMPPSLLSRAFRPPPDLTVIP
jgi:hypothetical protein